MAVTVSATHTQPVRTKTPLTTAQKKGFLAAYAGWTLDGMDAFIYALVLVPALRDLLPASGIAATGPNIGAWGSRLFAMFLFVYSTPRMPNSPKAPTRPPMKVSLPQRSASPVNIFYSSKS